jgi:hypothetical protein
VPTPQDPNVLDYVPPPPPLKRRDSVEYYREPPRMADWGFRHLIGWLVAFVVVGFALVALIGRWLAAKGL